MDPALLLAFVVAATLLIVIPGPNIGYIVATSIAHGFRCGIAAVAGTTFAMVIQLAVTSFGLVSAALILSEWFEVLRWLGVAYLLYLGIQSWRTVPSEIDAEQAPAGRPSSIFWRGFFVATVNPKTLFFLERFCPSLCRWAPT